MERGAFVLGLQRVILVSVVDDKFQALGDLGFTGTLNDRELQWLQSLGATSDILPQAWKEAMIALGQTDYDRNSSFYDFLGTAGYEGSYNDRAAQFWANGAVLPASDPYWNQVTLLAHLDDNLTTNEAGSDVTVVGSVTHETGFSKFGAGQSLYTASGHLQHEPLDTSAPFTIECYTRLGANNTSNNAIAGNRDISVGNRGLSWIINTADGVQVNVWDSAGNSVLIAASANGVFVNEQLNHVALTRNAAGLWTIWLEGTSIASGTEAGTAYGALDLCFGIDGPNAYSNGTGVYMDEIRVTEGTARYTSNFTVPTEAFPSR